MWPGCDASPRREHAQTFLPVDERLARVKIFKSLSGERDELDGVVLMKRVDLDEVKCLVKKVHDVNDIFGAMNSMKLLELATESMIYELRLLRKLERAIRINKGVLLPYCCIGCGPLTSGNRHTNRCPVKALEETE